jgi:hypothetical protein
MENNFVRLLIEIDDFEGARAHAKTARHYASMTQSPRADIFASVAEGLAEVFSGYADVGISRLTAAFERAVSLKVTSRDVLVALVKAHEHIGQHDKALEYLNMMLEQQRKTQAANVLQHVKRHLEQLHVADKDSPIEDASQIIKKLLTRAEVFEGRVAKSELQKRDQQLFVARVEVMERLAVAATLCEDRSGERVYRVGRLASLLAHMLGEDDHTVFRMEIATRLYDIGKGSIPDSIRHKASAYTPGEYGLMKMHTVIGAELLAKSEITELQMAITTNIGMAAAIPKVLQEKPFRYLLAWSRSPMYSMRSPMRVHTDLPSPLTPLLKKSIKDAVRSSSHGWLTHSSN